MEPADWISVFSECDFNLSCDLHPNQTKRHYCIQCCVAYCKNCDGHNSHSNIQVFKYHHKDVVRTDDIKNYLPISEINKFKGDSFVVIKSPPKPKGCDGCGGYVQKNRNFCSIGCKVSAPKRDEGIETTLNLNLNVGESEETKKKGKGLMLFPEETEPESAQPNKRRKEDGDDDKPPTLDLF